MPVILYGLLEQRPGHPNFGSPFYVGIGTRRRPYRHFALARSKKKHPNQALQGVLEAHFALDIDPIVRIIDTFQTYAESFVAEIAMIKHYGRMAYEPGGTLCNLAPGGQSTDPEAQRLSWLDEGIRAKRVAGMKGVRKTDTPSGRAARKANANLPKSAEAIALMRAAAVRSWANPEFAQQRSVERAAMWQDPEKRANMLEGRGEIQTELWKDPAIREKRTTAISGAVADKWANDPDYAERARAGLRAAWQDPAKKAARVAKMRAAREAKPWVQTEEGAKNRSEAMKRLNAAKSTEARAAVSAGTWADPEKRKQMSEAMKLRAQDPELKARRVAAMAAGKRRKAAEQAALPLQAAE